MVHQLFLLIMQLYGILFNSSIQDNPSVPCFFFICNYSVTLFAGLDHEQNMKKMRLLSFMQLAERNPEISFDVIEKELQIKPDDVESFIIEGIHIIMLCVF